jgi:hypothetical protein
MTRSLILIVALLILCSVHPVASQTPPALDAERAGKAYLEAIRASDIDRVRPVATPRMTEWTGTYMKVVYDYRVIRGESMCSGSSEADAVRAPILRYQATAQILADTMLAMDRTEERRKALDDMKSARAEIEPIFPCLASTLQIGGHHLFSEQFLSRNGSLGISLYRILVDIETPGRSGAKKTERRQLSLGQASLAGSTTGWKVIGFGVLQ